MKGKKVFMGLFVVILLVVSFLFLENFWKREEKLIEEFPLEIPLKAWEFSLSDLSGNTVSLRDFKNRVILLTFWMSKCPFCIRDIPILKNIYYKYPEEKVKIVSVVVNEDKESIKRFRDKEKIPYLILLDEDREASRLYEVIGVPTNIIIDQEENIKYYNFFWPSNLEEIIDNLLSKKGGN